MKLKILFFFLCIQLFSAQNQYLSSEAEISKTYVMTKMWTDNSKISDSNIDGFIYVKDNGVYYVLKEYLNGEPINAKIFGVKADGVTDDTAALQKAFTIGANLGATIYLPSGIILTSSQININTNNKLKRKLKIQGAGVGNCIIRNTGSKTPYVFLVTGNYFDRFEIKDFRIERPDIGKPDGGCALRIENEYLANIENIDIFRFSTGVEFNDVNSTYMKSVNVRWCGTGMSFKRDSGQSNPNLIELNNCVFNSSSNWGIELKNPHNVNFISCQFEGNLKGGINAIYSNSNGSVSINVFGSYFEYNGGTDIYIKSLREGVHNIIGNTFNRISNKLYSTHNIVLEIPGTVNYENKLNMIGNGMLNANDYQPSKNRSAVKIISERSTVKILDSNSYKNEVEKPDYSNKAIIVFDK